MVLRVVGGKNHPHRGEEWARLERAVGSNSYCLRADERDKTTIVPRGNISKSCESLSAQVPAPPGLNRSPAVIALRRGKTYRPAHCVRSARMSHSGATLGGFCRTTANCCVLAPVAAPPLAETVPDDTV